MYLHLPKRKALFGIVAGTLAAALIITLAPKVLAVIGHQQGGGASSHAGHSIRQSEVVTNGLVAWYPLDGNAKDASGNGNDGTATGSPVQTAGKFGKAYNFSGSSYINVASASSNTVGGDLSLSFWMNPSDWADASYQYQELLTKSCGCGSGTGIDYELREYGGGQGFQFIKSVGGANRIINSSASSVIPVNGWSHVVLTFNSSTFATTFYLNGQSYGGATITSGSISTSGYPISIGSRSGTNTFKGSMDDVRVYNRALSSNEVSQIYQGSQPINCDQYCVGWWKLDEASGTTAKNSTGNGNTGTLTGFTFDGTTNGWTSGVFGNGLQFDGSSDYVSVPDSTSLRPTGSFSLAGWIKNAGTPGSGGTVIGKWQAGSVNGADSSYSLGLSAASPPTLALSYSYNCSNFNTLTGTQPIASGEWYFVAFTFDFVSSVGKLYVNGVQDPQTGSGLSFCNSTHPVRIGAVFSNNVPISFFTGVIDDVRVYSRALVSYEVYDQYSAGR